MCGIIGSVGKANDLKLSFALTTHLLRETQRRGPHATGHFIVEDVTSETFWFKSPIPSKIYTGLAEWKIIREVHTRALMGHARYKTKGNEYSNNNNHPHISTSGNLALIHNGTIYKFEEHKDQYTLLGESDSEMLLKMIIQEGNIVNGITKIYETFGDSGDFACMVIYRNPETKHTRFFFFRDPGRPGRFIDASKELGQYFFCSTTPIWNDALRKAEQECPTLAKYCLKDLPVQIIPSFQVWEIDTQTMKITKHQMKQPLRREKKPLKETKTTKVTTAYERWEKKKRRNTITPIRSPYSVSAYDSYNSIYRGGSAASQSRVDDDMFSSNWYARNLSRPTRPIDPIRDKIFVHDQDDEGAKHFPHHDIVRG